MQNEGTGIRVLEINCTDLVGKAFNGYELCQELNRQGWICNQLVRNKASQSEDVISIEVDEILHEEIKEIERQHGISHLLMPYGQRIIEQEAFQKADIVHFHILHNYMISLLDYSMLMNGKKAVWTIHDPWIFTGNCLHPMECEKWKTGCGSCRRIGEQPYPMRIDNTSSMWKIKKEVLSQVNPHVVVSGDFMKNYIENSPMTMHWNKIHTIPFGIEVEKYEVKERKDRAKRIQGFDPQKILVCFRASYSEVKGSDLAYEVIKRIGKSKMIQFVSVGESHNIPIELEGLIEHKGWLDQDEMAGLLKACDILLMPSRAESFGLMALEAMAARCVVLSFEGTAVSINSDAPNCGVSVPFGSVDRMASEIERLAGAREELERRGRMGETIVNNKYQYKSYVGKHMKLYQEIIQE